MSLSSFELWRLHNAELLLKRERLRRLWPGDELGQCTPEDAIDRLTLLDLEDKPFIEGLLWLIIGSEDKPEIPTELQLRIIRRIWALREVEKREQEILKNNFAR